jgi:signal peptidase I
MKNGNVFINGKLLQPVGKIQKRFLALMKEYVTEDFLLENNLGDFTFPNPKIAQTYVEAGRREGRMVIPYHFYTYQENFEKLKKHPSVLSIFEDVIDDGTGRPRFPDTNNTVFLKHKWDMNNYGPIYLPKRNETIALTKDNWDFLKLAINKYENNNIVCLNGKFYEDGGNGKEITSYTFKMGYYWMIGDNRYNSLDSRYWGYVPEDHIIGKPLFTFFSLKMVMNIDEETNEPFIGHGGPEYVSKGIRWNKILKMID